MQPTRDDILEMAQRFRRAARLLELHASRCVELQADAHATAARQAAGMVRSILMGDAQSNQRAVEADAARQS